MKRVLVRQELTCLIISSEKISMYIWRNNKAVLVVWPAACLPHHFFRKKYAFFFWRNNEARELFLSHSHALHDSFRNKCFFFSEEIRRHAGFWLNNQGLIISSEEQAFFFWRNDEACCHLSGQHMPHHFYCVKWLCFLEKSMKHAGACGIWYMSMLPNLKNPPTTTSCPASKQ